MNHQDTFPVQGQVASTARSGEAIKIGESWYRYHEGWSGEKAEYKDRVALDVDTADGKTIRALQILEKAPKEAAGGNRPGRGGGGRAFEEDPKKGLRITRMAVLERAVDWVKFLQERGDEPFPLKGQKQDDWRVGHVLMVAEELEKWVYRGMEYPTNTNPPSPPSSSTSPSQATRPNTAAAPGSGTPQAASGAPTGGGTSGPSAPSCEQCGQPLQEVRFKDGTVWSPAQLAGYARRKHGKVLCQEHYAAANEARKAAVLDQLSA